MHIAATVFMAAYVLVSAVFARPTSVTSSLVNARTDCPALTPFYACASNGFNGCCSVNPCALAGCPDPTTTTPIPNLFTYAPAAPSSPGPEVQTNECPPGQHEIHQPQMWTIFSAYPNLAGTNGTDVSFSQVSNENSVRQQVAVFSGIPSTAKNCGLQWYHNATSTFIVDNSGLADVFAVKTPLPTSVTWNTIEAGLGQKIGQADFTSWPGFAGNPDHIVASGIECAPEMIFKVGLSGVAAGDVELEQSENSGFYVQYEC